jgi:Zn-dependent protease
VIGKIAGAPVVVTPSWLVAAVVLTFVFTPTVRASAPALASGGIWAAAFLFVLLLFVSVLCHEAAHAVVARSRGHQVTELAMTLWGGHTAYTGTQKHPLDGVLIAVVGPLTNLALAAGFWFAAQAAPSTSLAAALLRLAFFANVFVGVFNLLPGLPLDGGQVLEALVWKATGSRRRGTVAAGWVGRAVAVAVLAVALVWPVLAGRRPDLFDVALSAVVGSFLWQGAGEAIRGARRREIIDKLTVRQFAGRAVTVFTGTAVADAPRAVQGVPDAALVVVDLRGAPLGWVDPATAATVPAGVVATTPVDAVVVPFPAGSAVDANLSGSPFLEHLAATSAGARIVPVVDHGRVTGVLDVARVASALRPR